MSITRPPVTITSAWGDAITNWINARTPVQATSNTVTSSTTTTEIKDSPIGDVTLTVTDATTWYRITYNGVVSTDTASAALVGLRVRDGGSSSPTNTSTVIANGLVTVGVATGGQGNVTCIATGLKQFTVGTHNIAGFFLRVAGAGNITIVAGSVPRYLLIEPIT
jgi:hypothetical protein